MTEVKPTSLTEEDVERIRQEELVRAGIQEEIKRVKANQKARRMSFGQSIGPVIITACSLGYFLPWCVAKTCCHKNTGAIGALNFFFGWTFVGWVVALVWALTK